MKFAIVLFFIFSIVGVAKGDDSLTCHNDEAGLFSVDDELSNCPDDKVNLIHNKALKLIGKTKKLITSDKHEPLVAQALDKLFKLNLKSAQDQKKIRKVFSNILKVSSGSQKTKYHCPKKNRNLVCLTNQLAFVPPPKKEVYLCPSFFTSLTEEKQVATVIHEWFHKEGGADINYLFEDYCHGIEDLSADVHIREADQYMLFIYYLGNDGKNLKCF